MNILIVSADVQESQQLESLLKEHGYKVKTTRHGQEALSLLENGRFTAVVSDFFMPVMDGFQLLRAMVSHGKLKQIPFIFVTDSLDEEGKTFALKSGADTVLSLHTPDLLAVVSQVKKTSLPSLGEMEFLEGYIGVLRKYVERMHKDMEDIQKKLSHSQEEYRYLFEGAHDATFILDTTGAHVEANKKASELLGYTSEEFEHLSFREIVAPSSIPDSEEKLVRLLRGEDIPVYEKEFRAKDGRVIPVEISVSGIRDESGRVNCIQSIVRDITERKQTREELRRREEQYRYFYEKAPIGLFRADSQGIILMANASLVSILERASPAEIVGNHMKIFGLGCSLQTRPPDDDETPLWTEAEWVGREGGVRFVRESVRRVRDAEGNLLYCEGAVEDITERKRAEQELRESEERYRNIVELAPDGILTTDLKGTIISANTASIVMSGFSREEIIGKSFAKLPTVHLRDIPKYAMVIKSLLKGKQPTPFEVSWLHKDGMTRYGEVHYSLMKRGGKATGFQALVRDTTERKHAEEMLRLSEQKYRSLMENLTVGVYRITPGANGRFIDVNQAFARMLGYTREEILKSTAEDIYANPQERNDISAKGRTNHVELQLKKKDGNLIYVSDTGKAVKDTKGNVLFFDGIAEDITERKRVEEDLNRYRHHLEELVEERTLKLMEVNEQLQREIAVRTQTEESLAAEKERLSVTLRSIGDGVITTDIGGKVVLMNKVAEQLTGWTQQEAAGLPLTEVFRIIRERTREPCENPVEKVLRQGAIMGLGNDTVLIHKDGIERIIADSGAPIRDRESRVVGVVLVFRDVTERRKMEQELLKAQKLESVGILAGGIAHDFNNILTAIMGNTALAKTYTGDNKVLDKLTKIERASVQARDLTEQLLTFSKGGAPIKKVTSIGELIKSSTSFALRGSNVRCHFFIAEDLWHLDVDEGQISQVINNLIINADQAMPDGGIIEVRAENVVVGGEHSPALEPGEYVKITVKDQGIGISERYLPKIFDPYFTTKQKGSGLGLATSYSILKRHNGHIQAESEVGVGSTFSIWLPAVRREKEKKKHGTREEKTGEWRRKEKGIEKEKKKAKMKAKVLLMDDEEIIQEAASEALRHLGYGVDVAGNGKEVIEKYAKAKEMGEPFDVVIMDLTVRGGAGGKEATQYLLEIDPRAKVIVSSGYSNAPIMAEYKTYGFKGVVTKPYSIEELNETIRKVLEEE